MGIIVQVLSLVLLFLFTKVSHCATSSPRMILVGGSIKSWKVPDSPNNTLNNWAEKTRFKVGDILVWKYDTKVDSVLQVRKEDYDTCNTTKPLKQYNDGDTKVELDKSGPFYFISGAPGNCAKGEKITLVVLAERNSGGGGSTPSSSPKASPVTPTAHTPTPAPAANAAARFMAGNGWFLTALIFGLALA